MRVISKNTKSNSARNIINLMRVGIVLLMPLLLLISPIDTAYSKQPAKTKKAQKVQQKKKVSVSTKKKRYYNPKRTKEQAIAVLQTSDELIELAGLEPKQSSHQSYKNISMIENNDISDIELLRSYFAYEDDIGEIGEDIAELEAEDDVQVNVRDFKALWLLAIGEGEDDRAKTSYGLEKAVLMNVILGWLGTPYKFGGNSQKAIDCSAWTKAIFYQADSIILPRTAREQEALLGRKVSREKLVFGDLVFFYTYSKKFVSHVGIYLGDDLFAHASSLLGVTVSSLNSTYYAKRFCGGKRFTASDRASYRISRNSRHNYDYDYR